VAWGERIAYKSNDINDILQGKVRYTIQNSADIYVKSNEQKIFELTRTDFSGGYEYDKLVFVIYDSSLFQNRYGISCENGIYLIAYEVNAPCEKYDTYTATSVIFNINKVNKLDNKFLDIFVEKE
jgi:hypothetical protein